MSEPAEPLLRWILGLPLAAAFGLALVVGFVRRSGSGRLASVIACSAVAGSLVLAGTTYVELIRQPPDARRFVDWIGTWIGTGVGEERFTAELALQLDPLTGLLALFVAGVALAVHVSAARAQWGDRRALRFFATLGFFTFASLLLALAEDLVLLFLAWQGASLGQVLLSGHRFDERPAARGASANGVAQRIADAGFVVGLLLGFTALVANGAGTLDVSAFATGVAGLASAGGVGSELGLSLTRVDAISAGFVVAALARGAQGPFLLLWNRGLHGRFESLALVQGALAPLLGVALLIRLAPLLEASPLASVALLWIGVATALVASALAGLQRDLVRALGLLLAGQLGFAFAALGVHAPVAALFHVLMTSSVFALLFLCAGRIHEALRHSELDRMGALRIRLWHVHLAFAVGVLTLAGAPLSGGFFSRNEVLASVAAWDGLSAAPLARLLFLAAFLNAAAALWVYFRIFWGESRAAPRLGEPQPELDTWAAAPLWALAAFAALGGILGIPQAFGDLPILGVEDAHSLRSWLASQPGLGSPEPETSVVLGVAGASIAVFVLAFALARRLALAPPTLGAGLEGWIGRVREATGSGRASQWLTDRTATGPLRFLANRVVEPFDRRVFDAGLVRGLPSVLTWVSQEVMARAQPGRTTFAVLSLLVGTGALVLWSLQ